MTGQSWGGLLSINPILQNFFRGHLARASSKASAENAWAIPR